MARRESARRLQVVFGLTVLTALSLAFIGFVNSSWLDIETVAVVGNDNVDTTSIIEASEIEVGQPLARLDLDTSANLVAEVPWVGSAVVRRSWDGSIVIEVTERGPIAAIPTDQGYALVDDRGRQLDVADHVPEGFLPITGVSASGVEGETVDPSVAPTLSVVRALPPELAGRTVGIDNDGSGVRLTLTGGGVVILGDDRELGAKFQSAQTMLDRVDLTCLAAIDVRVPGAPTLTRLGPADGGPTRATEVSAGGATTEEPQSGPAEC